MNAGKLSEFVWTVETRGSYWKANKCVLSFATRVDCSARALSSFSGYAYKISFSFECSLYKKAVLSQRWPRNAPYTWCPENFRDSLTTPTATIPNIFYGLLFWSTLWMFLQNLKSVALPVPEIIGGTQKIGQSLDTPMLHFLQNFNGFLFGLAL